MQFRLIFTGYIKDFSDSEFKKWMEDCTAQGTSPPTLEDVEKKLQDIKDAMNYQFKEEDISQVIRTIREIEGIYLNHGIF